jgi:hypothetical protein
MKTSEIIKYLLTSLLTLLFAVPILLAKELIPSLLELIEYTLSKKALLLLVSLLFAITVILISYLTYLKTFFKLKAKFGVYWDKNKNAYCRSCKDLLGAYEKHNHEEGFYCIKCDRTICLQDEEKYISLNQALKRI